MGRDCTYATKEDGSPCKQKTISNLEPDSAGDVVDAGLIEVDLSPLDVDDPWEGGNDPWKKSPSDRPIRPAYSPEQMAELDRWLLSPSPTSHVPPASTNRQNQFFELTETFDACDDFEVVVDDIEVIDIDSEGKMVGMDEVM